MRVKYLFISYEAETLLPLKKRLEATHGNLEVTVAFNLRDGLKLYNKKDIHLLALNIFMGKHNAYQLLSTLRQDGSIPIIVLAPFKSEEEIVKAYRFGANFCIKTPAGIELMVACFDAFYRRNIWSKEPDGIGYAPVMRIRDDLIIRPQNRTVTVNSREIKLTAKEFDLLYFLACNADRVLTQEQIFMHVWKSDDSCNSDLTSRIALH